MNRQHLPALLCAAAAGLLALFATACGSGEDVPAGAKTISLKLTDSGCEPHAVKTAAGPLHFVIENDGTSKVTEMEIMDGETVLGEKENISEGMSGDFSLTLEAGTYTIYCPGGDQERGTLKVSGASK
jgi:iron uptake system component EfeO